MKTVFLLEHSYELEGIEKTKCIGIYTTEMEAKKAIERLSEKPGFKNYKEDFCIDEYNLNQDHWTSGFATIATVMVKNSYDEWIPITASCKSDETYELHFDFESNEFKDGDTVKCEERDGEFYAIKKVKSDY